MRRPIFSNSNGIVSQNINRRNIFHGRHTNRRLQIIRENKEGGTISQQSSMQEDSVLRTCHAEFADTEMDIASFRMFRIKNSKSFDVGLRGSRHVSASAKRKGHFSCQTFQEFSTAIAGCFRFCSFGVPVFRKIRGYITGKSILEKLIGLGMVFLIFLDGALISFVSFCAAFSKRGGEVGINGV